MKPRFLRTDSNDSPLPLHDLLCIRHEHYPSNLSEEMITIGKHRPQKETKPSPSRRILSSFSVFIDRFTTIISGGGDRISHHMDDLQFRSVGTIKIADCTSIIKLYRTRQI